MSMRALASWPLVLAACASVQPGEHPNTASQLQQSSQHSAVSETSDQAWRLNKPTPALPKPVPLPTIKRFKLSNGIPAYVVEHHVVPMVVTRVLIGAGNCANPPGRAGLANFVASLVVQRDQFVQQLEDSGGTLSSGTSQQFSYVSLETISRSWPDSIDLLSQLIQHASFDSSLVERRRSATLAEIGRLADNGPQLSGQVLQSLVYGSADPCSAPVTGTKESVSKLTANDLSAFYGANWNATYAAIVVVGEVDSSSILPTLERTFGKWRNPKNSAQRHRGAKAATTPSEGHLVLVDRPGATQVNFAVGHWGPPMDSEDWPAVVVMTRALGGFYFSRLTRNLRIQKGYIYSSNSTVLTPSDERSMISLRNAVPIDKAGISIAEVLKEVRGMIDTPPHDQELELAKTSASDGLAMRLQGNSQIAAFLDEVAVNDLPAEYVQTYYDRLRTVTSDDVALAARRFFSPDQLQIVLVGPANVVKNERELSVLGVPIEATAARYVDRGSL